MRPTAQKIKTLAQLTRVIEQLKAKGKTIVTTNGCFDLLHPGHIRFLNKAGELGDILVVAVNSDDSVQALKGAGRPVYSERDRAEMLAALEAVDYVIIFHEQEPSRILLTLKPHIHVKGRGYIPAELPEYRGVIENGGRVEVIEALGEYSTTAVINKLLR